MSSGFIKKDRHGTIAFLTFGVTNVQRDGTSYLFWGYIATALQGFLVELKGLFN